MRPLPLPPYHQAFLLYWVLWPAAGWPATLLTRVLLLVLPQALWVMMHVLLWVSMRHVLQHFRWVGKAWDVCAWRRGRGSGARSRRVSS